MENIAIEYIFFSLPTELLFLISQLVGFSGTIMLSLTCKMDGEICDAAALKGHLEVLKRLKKEGCEWSYRTVVAAANGCEWSDKVCTYAGKSGWTHIIKWARRNKYPWNVSVSEGIYEWDNWKETRRYVVDSF